MGDHVYMSEVEIQELAALVNRFALDCHVNAIEHGWWDSPRCMPELIALMHSELSEALEAHRTGNPMCDKDGVNFSGIEEEFCDVMIRIFDAAGKDELDLGNCLIAKHKYNKRREYRHGGKLA